MTTVGPALDRALHVVPETGTAVAAQGEVDACNDRAMRLLQAHIPLALLVDLAAVPPIDSRQLLADEGLPDESWWLVDVRDDRRRAAGVTGASDR